MLYGYFFKSVIEENEKTSGVSIEKIKENKKNENNLFEANTNLQSKKSSNILISDDKNS